MISAGFKLDIIEMIGVMWSNWRMIDVRTRRPALASRCPARGVSRGTNRRGREGGDEFPGHILAQKQKKKQKQKKEKKETTGLGLLITYHGDFTKKEHYLSKLSLYLQEELSVRRERKRERMKNPKREKGQREKR